LKLNDDEKNTIELIRNLTKVNTSEINAFFKGLLLTCLLNYSENEPLVIPYIGNLNIKYMGDENKDDGRVAKLDVTFTPSNRLVRNIGQLEDVKNPDCSLNITEIDCINEIMHDIGSSLNKIMQKDN
jgi:hypothetical protein